MPKYDLAGNPLPESGGQATPQTGPGMPRPAAPPSYGVPPAYTPPSSDTPVRRDLSGNPLPASAPPPPGGQMPGQTPQPGAWPPPPMGQSSYGMPQARNDSGEKSGVPPEIAAFKWNWGAFGLTWLWCLNHRMIAWGVGLLVGGFLIGFVPGGGLVPLGVSIYFGIMGHKLGWQNRHFAGGVSEFIEVQRAWMKWAVGILLVSLLIVPILAALLFPIFARARMQAQMRANGGYTQPYNAPSGNVGGGPGGQ